MKPPPYAVRWLAGLVAAGVLLRLLAGLARGREPLLTDGYGFYLTLARNFLDGHGLCYALDGGCAERMPLYPLWLALLLASGTLHPGLVIVQSLLGGAVVWMAWALGRQLFDARVGLVAAAGTALNPYAVIHDTALQDTLFVNALMLGGLLLLLRGRQFDVRSTWLLAGTALAAAVLSNARVAVFLPCALAWVALIGGDGWQRRVRATALVGLPMVVLLGGWAVRNWQLVGAPVLTTEAGERLWFGNNRWTFAHFPERSIDLTGDELQQIPAEARALLENFPGSEAERDALVRGWALDYMAEDPGRTAMAAAQKIWVTASAQLSPSRGPVVQFGYAALFLPVHLLSVAGLGLSRHTWRVHSLVWLLLLSFAVTTAAFWAHTSHKSYLDAILFIYAAFGAGELWRWRVRAT